MKRYLNIFILFSASFLLSNCKTNRFVNKERAGKWIYIDTINGVVYKSVGKFKKGIEKKKWRSYADGKYVKKEKYKNGICYVTNYYPSGKIASKGKTKLIITDKLAHWFYYDYWYFYDESGALVATNFYADGILLGESKP